QALLEDLAGLDGADAAADVGHVRGRRRERDEPLAMEDRLQHRDVAHVTGAQPGVVGDEHVAGPHGVGAQLADEVAHGGRQAADEGRDAAAVLGQCRAAGVGQHAGEVVGLVGERRERRAHDGLGRLVDDRDDARPQDLQRDGVDGRAHGSVTMMLPVAATWPTPPDPITRVEPSSSRTAGPRISSPGASFTRSYTVVSTKRRRSGKYAGRVPLTAPPRPRPSPSTVTSAPATGARTATRMLMNSIGTSG